MATKSRPQQKKNRISECQDARRSFSVHAQRTSTIATFKPPLRQPGPPPPFLQIRSMLSCMGADSLEWPGVCRPIEMRLRALKA